jgi:sugar O-acyltransferase (sialic acid O-acetyltransferase NeuD family)
VNGMLVTVGAGGFGREALDVLQAANDAAGALLPYALPAPYRLVGVLDDAPNPANLQRLADRSIRYLGPVADWLRAGHRADYLVAVGEPAARAALVGRFTRVGLQAATLVHPSAVLGSRVVLGEGVLVCAGVRVSTNVTIGRHGHLNPGATIGHDTVIADFVSVNPAATISGECRIGAGALVGAGAVILAGLSVGAGSTVGAAACVTRPVEAGEVVRGVPAVPSRTAAAAAYRAYTH